MRKSFLVIFLSLYALSCFANYEATIGFKASEPEYTSDASSGIELTLGKRYLFNENFGAKTAVDFSYVGKTYDIFLSGQKVAELDFSEYNFGLLQRFFYNLESTSITFRPFIDLGLGYAYMKGEATSSGRSESSSESRFYYKYDLGFQLLSPGGIGGELKWGQNKNKDYVSDFAAIAFVYNF